MITNYLNQKEVEKKARAALEVFGLEMIYSVEKLQSNIKKLSSPREWTEITGKIIKQSNAKNIDQINALFNILSDLHNISPHDALGGLSPQELVLWREQRCDIAGNESYYSDVAILKDVKMLLRYISVNEVKTTEVSKNLTRKDTRAINEKLCQSDEIDFNWGDRVSLCTCEEEARTVNFIRNLIEIAGLIKKNKSRFVVTKKGRDYLNSPKSAQFQILFDAWRFKANWAFFCLIDLAEEIQDFQQPLFFQLAAILDINGEIIVREFDKGIKAILRLKGEVSLLDSYYLIFKYIEYFGLAYPSKSRKDILKEMRPIAYKFTPLGRFILINSALLPYRS